MRGQVLIVGAGPTGLTLACELHRRGVACRLIERSEAPHVQSRATDIQPRTLELLVRLGCVDAVLAQGTPRTKIVMLSQGQPMMEVDTHGADTPFGFTIGLEQHRTEAILEARLGALGGGVERGVRMAELSRGAEGCRATLLRDDHTWWEEDFDWVVGCDGAHSTTRHLVGAAFGGTTFREDFFLVDLTLDYSFAHDTLALYLSDQGLLLTLPLPGEGRVRLFGDLEPGGEDPDLGDLSEVERLVLPRMYQPDARISNLGWGSVFRLHTRQVDDYRHGRVLLAGDAAHIHSPTGGHGMNTGMQDAFNLAWKLALVQQGRAAEGLLDTYHEERHPVAAALLTETDLETRLAMWRNTWGQEVVGRLMGLMMGVSPLRQRQIAQALELHVHYRDGRLAGEYRTSLLGGPLLSDPQREEPGLLERRAFGRGPQAGERAPDVTLALGGNLFELLDAVGFDLLIFDGYADTDEGYEHMEAMADELVERWGGLVRPWIVIPSSEVPEALEWDGGVILDADQRLHERYGARAECLYLIRPDGYIAFRSQPADAEALEDHLVRVLGLVPPEGGDVLQA